MRMESAPDFDRGRKPVRGWVSPVLIVECPPLRYIFGLTKTSTHAIRHDPEWLSITLLLIVLNLTLGRGATEFNGAGICQFKLVNYTLPRSTENAINTAVGKSLSQHRKVFGFKVRPGFKVRMRIFGRYDDYEQFTLADKQSRYIAQHAGSITNLSGYYSHRTREVVTWRQAQPGSLANNILHEASHAIMLAHYRRVPIWLGEGCATYFSYPPNMQDEYDVGSLKYRWAKLNLWLRESQLPALPQFLNLSEKEWRNQDIDQAYTVSWSLFQFLMSSPANQRILRQLLEGLQQNPGRTMDCAALITRFYPGGTTRLERDWHSWIAQGGHRILGPEIDTILTRIKKRT